MTKKKFILGTRGSKLALWQSEHVAAILKEKAGVDVELQIIKTQGDKILDVALAKIGDKGLFVKELENALLDGSVDFAVHSSKDVPTQLPDGLTLGAFLKRVDPRDVIISKSGKGIDDLAGRIGCRNKQPPPHRADTKPQTRFGYQRRSR
jgi:hydroxymethylbilane synthase